MKKTQNKTSKVPFFLKRLHSLLGVLPLCSFVLYHIIKNGIFMSGNPQLIQWVFAYENLWVVSNVFPIILRGGLTFHGIYGIYLLTKTKYKGHFKQYTHRDNLKFYAQRLSCVFMLLFLGHHLSLVFRYPASEVATEMALALQSPLVLILYCLGTISAIFHACNGISTAVITWGVCVTEKSQKICACVMDVIFVIFSLAGTVILFLLKNY